MKEKDNEVIVKSPDSVKKLAELGILRAMPVLKEETLEAGRLLGRMLKLKKATTEEMIKVPHASKLYVLHKPTIQSLLEIFQNMTEWMSSDSPLHVTAAFCLKIVENSKFEYSPKISEALTDIIEYHSRVDLVPDENHDKKCAEVIEAWNSIVIRSDGDLESPFFEE